MIAIKRRSFSLLLARRYLNPRRAQLSSFTLISLTGVVLGVVVLVVVMAVYAGLERNVKNRLLGFTPHILMRQHGGGPELQPLEDWRAAQAVAVRIPGVAAALPFVSDNAILDAESMQRPVMFRGMDTTDPSQVRAIQAMLDTANYPESTADMGMDDRVVVSSELAGQLRLGVGSTIKLYSTRNFEQVMKAYKATEKPPLREAWSESWQMITSTWQRSWKPSADGGGSVAAEPLNRIFDALKELAQQSVREPEYQQLDTMLTAMQEATPDGTRSRYTFSAAAKESIDGAFAFLSQSDPEAMDAEILKGLRQVVLPKEVEVCGVYQTSQMAATPDVFTPLHLAQGLAGLDDAVQGISLRLEDPYQAEAVAAHARQQLAQDWDFLTWGEQYVTFFSLIHEQRVMMYFALSFIVLVSAFSMMAVMFTVTIQKRREIGVMKALGATPGQIMRVFLYQGMLLGFLGAILGVVLGRLVIHYRGGVQSLMRAAGFDPFSAAFIGFETLPAHNNPTEQALIALMAFLLCSLAAMVPASFASRSDAAKSLRNL